MTYLADQSVDRFGRRVREQQTSQEPSAEDIERRETERKAKQKEVRQKLEASKIASESYAELQTQINSLEAEKDSLANASLETCNPLQAELEKIEKQKVQPTSDRQSSEKRKKELLQQIRSNVANLEEAIDPRNRQIWQITAEMIELRTLLNQATPSQLLDYARPDLLVLLRATSEFRSTAHELLWKAQENTQLHSLARREAEIAIAEEFFETMTTKYNAAYQAAISL